MVNAVIGMVVAMISWGLEVHTKISLMAWMIFWRKSRGHWRRYASMARSYWRTRSIPLRLDRLIPRWSERPLGLYRLIWRKRAICARKLYDKVCLWPDSSLVA